MSAAATTTRSFKHLDPRWMNEVNHLKSALRGEISAQEAYRDYLATVSDPNITLHLQKLMNDHSEASAFLRKEILLEGVYPEDSSGMWGYIVNYYIKMAEMFGDNKVLEALRQGEQYGLSVYKDAFEHGDLSSRQKNYVRSVLIPQQQKHIESLDNLISIAS